MTFKYDEKNFFTCILDDMINEMNLTSFEVNFEHFKENFDNFDMNDYLEMIFKDLEMNFMDQVRFNNKARNKFNEKMNKKIFKTMFNGR